MRAPMPHRLDGEALVRERALAFAHWARRVEAAPGRRKPVWRLRTSARRLEAAMVALRPLLRKKSRVVVRSEVNALRRAAGPVRDADVLMQRLAERLSRLHDPKQVPAIGYLIGRLGALRDEASRTLALVSHEALGSVDAIPERLAEGLRTPMSAGSRSLTMGQVAGEAMRAGALRFASMSEQDLTDLERLHDLRKAGKRVRYTVEVFRPILPDALASELMARLRDCQQRLGAINDRCELLKRIDGGLERRDCDAVREGLERLRAEEAARLEHEHSAFVRWWWDVGAAQQLLGCAHELAVVRSEAAVA